MTHQKPQGLPVGELLDLFGAPERVSIPKHVQDSWSRDAALEDATLSSARHLAALARQAREAEDRERIMLRWTRISGVAAIVAAVLSLVAIVVAFLA